MAKNIIEVYDELLKRNRGACDEEVFEEVKPKKKTIVEIYNELLSDNNSRKIE